MQKKYKANKKARSKWRSLIRPDDICVTTVMYQEETNRKVRPVVVLKIDKEKEIAWCHKMTTKPKGIPLRRWIEEGLFKPTFVDIRLIIPVKIKGMVRIGVLHPEDKSSLKSCTTLGITL
ncbi:TPA: hypothetical protein PNM72_002785 [Listeria monocytogenes]|uniref:Type II toxin-antitoxin system PemK/MazF family toxin n=1 Tax=Listeria monocytogenes TaxID=1639 RepID=A0A142EC64_LISMN|nr:MULTISPECIES: hypothetical protein [Listeria]EAE3753013.1 hypothetical protein [Listeria monocytogenes serotype 1/2a]EAG6257366.1 hypothetical protein [Listeria monocytogenes CFSAN003807]ALU84712.1 hypothetical protein AUZ28_14950 [Listeria monocytogenes]AMQ45752.1 hypothetical protein pA144_0007 [Listeria monocytogenes]EAA0046324.1 hypothetical protein [Listeria monocytogenes]